jgi:hypothetical protein
VSNDYLDLNYSIGIYIRICNHGAYLAKCYFESQPFSNTFANLRYDTGLFPVLQCSKFNIPFDAVWNRLECKALVFIAVYKTIFIKEFDFELLNTCYTLGGNILNPTWSKTICY